VLGLISLLAILALGALEATRRHAQLVQHSMESIQARELADSALRVAMLEWGTLSLQGGAPSPTGSRIIEVFGTQVPVTLELESGRIDLNTADEHLLAAAFAGNGYTKSAARSFAERVIDWRDADDSTGAHEGAERTEYRVAGERVGPRNASFETVSELLSVLGFEKLSPELLDAFTVYSHLSDVRQIAAPPAVLRALRWAQDQQLAGRTWFDESMTTDATLNSLAGEVARMHACAQVEKIKACRTAIVRFTGSVSAPVMVFSWESHR
jgi:general secretion pathway protein K